MAYDRQDSYFQKAKQEGYRSRAAYKLLELQQRFRLFKSGDLVVDLGAAPGGWLQVAARSVGRQGKVVGVDLQALEARRHHRRRDSRSGGGTVRRAGPLLDLRPGAKAERDSGC
jgi:23S rRNA (uridine2552-2'-O)-methyltransferase